MTAYMVLTHTVHDAAAFARDYIPAIRPVLQKHHIEVIAISLDTTPLAGEANSAVVFRAASEDVFATSTTTPTSRDRSRSATR